MRLSRSIGSIWPLFLALATIVSAYRPTQFCKHRGENGKADMCFALNTFYNTTTSRDDIYITLQTFRFKSSAKGWAAVGLGQRMIGALMFIVYGDPVAEGRTTQMQTVVRTATGHHPPLDVRDASVYSGAIPAIEIQRSEFVPYTGEYRNNMLDLVPTHVGISEIACFGCGVWEGFPIKNESLAQEMIWSTNSVQDFQGDFDFDRAIEMHQFGLGFGFLWVDFLNAHTTTETPWFPTIDETGEHAGMSEVQQPIGPTDEELALGDQIEKLGGKLPEPTPQAVPTSTADDQDKAEDENTGTSPVEPTPAPSDSLTYPTKTFRGQSLKDWMWHLHGLLMTLAFLILYPLGAYFIRSGKATAFNLHWTTQSLATVSLFIGAGLGFWQSQSISVAHQFLGLTICAAALVQLGLGWQHHRRYTVIKRKTWMSRTHAWLGRGILAAGFINLVLGILLRKYGRIVIFLLCLTLIAELIFLAYVLGARNIQQLALPPDERSRDVSGLGDEAEEYFQLVGDEDSDIEEDVLADEDRKGREDAKREQNKRLAALDKV